MTILNRRDVCRVVAQVLLCAVAAAAMSKSEHGQDAPDFESIYSLGVHQYFSEDYRAAYETLAYAKLIDPHDPRPYYFRGLAAYQLGYDGRLDFEVGARVEARVAGAATLVNRALERVQGPLRLYLEEIRVSARIAHEKASSNRHRQWR